MGIFGLFQTMKEFPEDLYDVIKFLTIISDVNNSGICFHISVSHRRTLVKITYFLFYFLKERKLNVHKWITTRNFVNILIN